MIEEKNKDLSAENKCPHIKNPFEGCYCTLNGSQHIEAAIHYCNGAYRECEIFKRNMDGG